MVTSEVRGADEDEGEGEGSSTRAGRSQRRGGWRCCTCPRYSLDWSAGALVAVDGRRRPCLGRLHPAKGSRRPRRPRRPHPALDLDLALALSPAALCTSPTRSKLCPLTRQQRQRRRRHARSGGRLVQPSRARLPHFLVVSPPPPRRPEAQSRRRRLDGHQHQALEVGPQLARTRVVQAPQGQRRVAQRGARRARARSRRRRNDQGHRPPLGRARFRCGQLQAHDRCVRPPCSLPP